MSNGMPQKLAPLHTCARLGKRALDVVVSVSVLVCLSPLWLLLVLLTRLIMGPPVLFRQQRAGIDSRPFTILKLRTMVDTEAQDGSLLDDEARLTGFGRFLRRWSLDEFPQLVNVVKGDMSLVGPRPLLMEYLAHYSPEQARRHDVKPGITGWAQVKGRNALSWEERFKLDVWYVDHWRLRLDFAILS